MTRRIGLLVTRSPINKDLVNSEIVSSTRYGKTRVFMIKTLSTETTYEQGLILDR